MAENKLYDYLNKQGLQDLAKGILKQVNARITERIATSISAESDDDHVASAGAVFRAIRDAQHTTIRTWIGDINDIPMEERSTTVFYYQKDNAEDPSWNCYIWDAENQEFVKVGTSDIDLSNYWTKDDTEALREDLGIPAIENDVAGLKGDVVRIDDSIATINSNIDNLATELEDRVRYEEIIAITKPEIKAILDDAYNVTDPFKFTEAASVSEVNDVLAAAVEAGATEVAIQITDNLDLDAGGKNTISVPAGVSLEVNIDEVTLECTDNAFNVAAGATLTLVGDGTIVAKTKSAKAAITAEDGSTVVIDGITIDGTTQGTENNWVYGVYAKNHSRVEFKSGVIKVAGASCISTNNTTGGSDIIVSGGELYSEGGYAIYCPAQGTVDITNAIVQGVHARMGTINIGEGAKIIPPAIDDSNAAPLGSNIATSGSVELGDAIVLIAGSYSDANGIDIELNITDDATVESNYRSAIGVYLFDTKAAANVVINVADGNNVSTTDADFDAIKIYDHELISAAAAEAGKTYNPVATSSVTLNVG